jgi:hypothetical protein
MAEHLDSLFPGLRGAGYRVSSPPTDAYNCIAWAVGDVHRWWWPDDPERTYWPAGVPRVETEDAFRAAFAAQGFLPCEDAEPEPGYEKVAVFVGSDRIPTHAARQLPDGRWTSKLGTLEDIEHPLDALSGAIYGSVVWVMKRPITPLPPDEPPGQQTAGDTGTS